MCYSGFVVYEICFDTNATSHDFTPCVLYMLETGRRQTCPYHLGAIYIRNWPGFGPCVSVACDAWVLCPKMQFAAQCEFVSMQHAAPMLLACLRTTLKRCSFPDTWGLQIIDLLLRKFA